MTKRVLAMALAGSYATRAVTAEQINEQARQDGGALVRTAEVRQINEDNRTVELAFSSEAPVARWFGDEILSHEAGAMRTERMTQGAALLVDHDWSDQIGVVESVSTGADRRGRAVVRFGRSGRASEIWQDVVDGIRKHVSVGYMVHRVDIEERDGKPDRVTITDWEPYEISIVAVPADPTVGVGRSMGAEETPPEGSNPKVGDTAPNIENGHRKGQPNMNERILRDGKGNLVRAKVDADGNIVEVLEMIEQAGASERGAETRGREAEQRRVRAIADMGKQYDAMDIAHDAISKGTDAGEFQRMLLDHVAKRTASKPMTADEAEIGLSDREVQQFSFMRALRALSEPTNRAAQEAAAFEYEASRAAAERMGRDARGIMVPADVLSRALNTSTTGTNPGDTGGYLVDTTLASQSFIEMLRNRTTLMQLGRTMGGLVGNVEIPKQESGATGYWLGEDAEATLSSLELGQIGLSPKTVAGMSEITRRMLMQSSLDVEAMVRGDLASALATEIDRAGFYGTGTNDQPLGIANYTGINAVNLATAGKPTFAEAVAMESAIAADNADVNSMQYVLNSTMRGHFKTTEKFSGTVGATIWEPGNTVNGYGTQVTNQIDSGDLFFGNFADLIIGMWGGLDLTVDPYTHSSRGRLRIVAMQDVDFALRRTESFALGRNTP